MLFVGWAPEGGRCWPGEPWGRAAVMMLPKQPSSAVSPQPAAVLPSGEHGIQQHVAAPCGTVAALVTTVVFGIPTGNRNKTIAF